MPRRILSPSFEAVLVAAAVFGGVCASGTAHARRAGIPASGCEGCHTGGRVPTVKITTDPVVIQPGASVTASVAIQAVNGNSAGLYMTSNVGKFSLVGGQPTTLVSDLSISHSAAKAATGSEVVFQVRWTAPSTPGGVYFQAWALSSNGNGTTSGDGEGSAVFSAAFGCSGTAYYIDFDNDGVAGSDGPAFVGCSKPEGYASTQGDCNDSNRNIYPGAPERCNMADDDCDGAVDEGLATGTTTLYPDTDADGYGAPQGSPITVQGCVEMPGYSPVDTDCNDRNRAIHPTATDVCNLLDDDCDGAVDENTRPSCGEGGCRRLSPTCNPADCVPKAALAEVCNGADEDCDSAIDEDENLCQAGRVCVKGICQADITAPMAGAGGTSASGGAPSAGGSSAGSGGRTSSGGTVEGGAGGKPPSSGGASGKLESAGSANGQGSESQGCSLGRGAASSAGAWAALCCAVALRTRSRRTRAVKEHSRSLA